MWLNGFAGKWELLDHAFRIIASDYLLMLLLATVPLGFWFAGKDVAERMKFQRSAMVAVASIGIGNFIVEFVTNALWARARPFDELGDAVNLMFYRSTDPSFPSNPIVVAFALAAAIGLSNRRVGFIMLSTASLFAVARVFVGASYPIDVIGGAIIGVLVAGFSYLLFELGRPLPEVVLRFLRGFGIA